MVGIRSFIIANDRKNIVFFVAGKGSKFSVVAGCIKSRIVFEGLSIGISN